MPAINYAFCRLIMPEVGFETVVTLPIFVVGQLPQTHIQQILDLYPDVNLFRLVKPGGEAMEFKRQKSPAEQKKQDKKPKSNSGVILNG